MDTLWQRFVAELTAAGYTTDDLAICTAELFVSIAEELRVFSQAEVAKLTLEWGRRYGTSATTMTGPKEPARARTTAVATPSPYRAPLPWRMDEPALVEQAARWLRRLLAVRAGESPRVTVDPSTCVVADPDTAAAALALPETVHVVWKLCSPGTVAKLSRGAALAASDDVDEVCASGLVFYRDSATRLGNVATGSLASAAAEGWVLAAFAVATGVARSVARREAHNLSQYRTAQCQAMMQDAGYDSLRVEDADCVVLFSVAPSSVQWLGCVGLQCAPSPPPPPPSAPSGMASTARLSTRPASAAIASSSSRKPLDTSSSSIHAAVSPRTQPVLGGSPSWMGASAATAAAAEDSTLLLSTRCSLHPQKEVEFWSPQEKRLLCSHCLYFDGYTRDNCLPIEQATHLEVPGLEKWMQNVATFSKEIAGVMDAFENAEADVQRQQERAVSVIRQEFGRLRSKLDAMERELMAQCEASAKDTAQQLGSSSQDVARTVQQVQRVVHDATEPLQRFHDGFTDQAVCIRLLRCTQRAFSAWPSVPVPPYMVIESVKDGVFLQNVSTAFDVVPPPTLIAGQVELPEAVDVNFLKNGCTD